jgi:hypothetical protein
LISFQHQDDKWADLLNSYPFSNGKELFYVG